MKLIAHINLDDNKTKNVQSPHK